MTDEIPSAVVAPRRRALGSLALPLFALLVAAWLGFRNWADGGVRVEVHADEGYGIKAGDPLRFRGITIGTVAEVALEQDLSGVRIDLWLKSEAEALAREGSRFWIVRPQLGLDGVQGLETVIGARYLAVLPGPAEAGREVRFEALPEPPLAERLEEDGLRLVLEAPSRFHLQAGAPLAYRQIQIGLVTDVDLASDASAVEVAVYVRPEYRALVRENSRFWETGGIEIDLQLMEGLSVEMESLRSLLVGGVALATPDDIGERARDGMRFRLHADAEKDWLEWRPNLPVGAGAVLDMEHPPLLAAELRWKGTGMLRRSHSRRGWLLPVSGGVVGPADLLSPLENVREPGATLHFGERSVLLEGVPERTAGGLARRAFEGLPAGPEWEPTREPLGAPRDCLVVGGGSPALRNLSVGHLTTDAGGWLVGDAARFDEEWHGAAVLGVDGTSWIGVLLVEEDAVRIAGVAGLGD